MTEIDPRIKEAYLYKQLKDNKVQCLTCSRYCILEEGECGYCKARKNISGKLFTLEYGDVSSYNLNPIEKKPAYHFYPGSIALTLGSWGCNFPCAWCQNFEISHRSPPVESYTYLSPADVINQFSWNKQIKGISLSFNEPTLSLEYALDIFKDMPEGYYKQFVTNAYMSHQALEELIDAGLDCMTVSIKGPPELIDPLFNIKTEIIFENLKKALHKGVHIELVYLLVTNFNDQDEHILSFLDLVESELSMHVPLHFTRYFPAHLYDQPPTSIKTLQHAYTLADLRGFHYVYLGNVAGHPLENTYCPQCSEILIKRDGFSLVFTRLTEDYKCPNCGTPIVMHPIRKILELEKK
ncbi:MAG: AmmeMemoRadiSam system radical SAM enzyme [Candidatus Heimdallarchaeaceae archaeon]